jgi:enoyl-CoA hydratase
MVADLGLALDRAESDANIRVIVLRGAGRGFSAGFDLETEWDESDRMGSMRADLQKDFDVIMRFWDSPKTTLSAVHGYCLGSGLELAVACDITIAAEGCRFGVPEVKFGSGIVSLILPWVTGPKAAKELLLTGDDRVSAERALSLGLINKVVPESDCFDETLKMARTIAANDRIAVDLTKQAINRTLDIMGMRQALLQALELDVVIEASETPESREFNEVLEKKGSKAAIAWREARMEKMTKAD